ncbi:MAG: serine hydrolase [Fimbriimonadaceae bacterium]|nr:serine hydrolase [Fimbriimonadaceae bacterium]
MSDFLVPTPALDAIASKAISKAKTEFPKVRPEQLAISIGKINRSNMTVEFGQFQGETAMYPASCIKLYYLAFGATLLENRKLTMTPELERGFTDMIVDSSNDATALILDTVTGTTGGPELSERELKAWQTKRGAVNRWLTTMGFQGINANQKTWNEGPYGRERQGYGPNFENRNSLTPNSGVRLMGLIALGKLVGQDRNAWMMKLLNRKIPADSKDADFQSRAFTGGVLPAGAQLWSKAGYTDTARLDIAWFKLANGHEYIFSIFTKGQSNEPKLIPFVAREILNEFGEKTFDGIADFSE